MNTLISLYYFFPKFIILKYTFLKVSSGDSWLMCITNCTPTSKGEHQDEKAGILKRKQTVESRRWRWWDHPMCQPWLNSRVLQRRVLVKAVVFPVKVFSLTLKTLSLSLCSPDFFFSFLLKLVFHAAWNGWAALIAHAHLLARVNCLHVR